MKLSRTSIGLAVRTAREAASLTLEDLAGAVGMTVSSLSRSENGLRDLAFAEVTAIAGALRIELEAFRSLAETYELSGFALQHEEAQSLHRDLVDLQRAALAAAIEARAVGR